MKYLILLMVLCGLSCTERKGLNNQMNTVYLKATSASLKYRNYTTAQVKFIFQGKKDSAALYEDSAKIYFDEYFQHMRIYDSLSTLFNK